MIMLKSKSQGCYTAAFIFFKLTKKKTKSNLKKNLIYESKHYTNGISSDLKESSVQLTCMYY